MANYQDKLRLATIFLLCLVNIVFGLRGGQMLMLWGGAVGLGYVATAAATGCARPAKIAST